MNTAVKFTFDKIVDRISNRMSRKYERCTVCQIPLAKDGHEQPAWCCLSECPRTKVRWDQRVNLEAAEKEQTHKEKRYEY